MLLNNTPVIFNSSSLANTVRQMSSDNMTRDVCSFVYRWHRVCWSRMGLWQASKWALKWWNSCPQTPKMTPSKNKWNQPDRINLNTIITSPSNAVGCLCWLCNNNSCRGYSDLTCIVKSTCSSTNDFIVLLFVFFFLFHSIEAGSTFRISQTFVPLHCVANDHLLLSAVASACSLHLAVLWTPSSSFPLSIWRRHWH